jgi:hypothetical protein
MFLIASYRTQYELTKTYDILGMENDIVGQIYNRLGVKPSEYDNWIS